VVEQVRIAFTRSRVAASPDAPDPAKGSMKVPSGGTTRRMSHAKRSTGLTVGWLEVLPWSSTVVGRSRVGALGVYFHAGQESSGSRNTG
jgi:hypothetical protein